MAIAVSDIYNAALERFLGAGVDWEAAGLDARMLLLKEDAGLTFDATHATVQAVLADAGNTECDDGSYARQAIAAGDRSEVQNGRTREAHIDAAVDFGAIDNENVGAAVIFAHVTDDTDSWPIAMIGSADFPITTNGAGFTINDGANGLFEIEAVVGA